MKGYNKPYIFEEPVIQDENVLVGCKRCNNYWYEIKRMIKNGCRINGAMRIYDYCDNCITNEEKNEQLKESK